MSLHRYLDLPSVLLYVPGAVYGYDYFRFHTRLCDFIAFFCLSTCFTSYLSITAKTIERYFYVCQPLLYDRILFVIFLIHYQLLWVVTPTDLYHLNDPSLYLQNDNNPEDKRTHSLMIKRRILTKLVNLLFDEINDVCITHY